MSERQFKAPETWIINLEFKTDRKLLLQRELPPSLKHAKWLKAVHGDTVKHPSWWTAGNGAWGCYRSHMQILEQCYNNRTECYLVLEDDATFRPGFDEALGRFLNALPSDWEMAYIGGQLLHEVKNPPVKINDEIYIPYNVNRTHGFMVNRRGYEKLYRHLMATPFEHEFHIDHHLGRLHETRGINVYVPPRWLIGQREDNSNITGERKPTLFWPDPERCATTTHHLIVEPKLVFLEAPLHVAKALETHHRWHQGNWKTEDGLDQGVCKAVSSIDVGSGLREWYAWASREVIRDDLEIPCLYHPVLTIEQVRKYGIGKIIHIQADNTDDAVQKYRSEIEA